jgi:hypothetical protein
MPEFDEISRRLDRISPFDGFVYRTASFDTANEYIRVFHDLNVENPYSVRYLVIGKDCDCTISDNRLEPDRSLASAGPEWDRNFIVLKSNIAPSTADLLITIIRDE